MALVGFGFKIVSNFSVYPASQIPIRWSTENIFPNRQNIDASKVRIDYLSLINLGAK